MPRNVSFIMVFLLLLIPTVVSEPYDSEEVLVNASTIFVDENTIFFEYDKVDKPQYFSVDIQIQVKPANVVLLLDESSSMKNKDIEDNYGITSISRMEIQKRIARQILESINDESKDNASEIAIVIFGGDEIREYGFDSDRETLKRKVDEMTASGDRSRGGEGLSQAIDLAIGCGRQCIIIVISDGLEVTSKEKNGMYKLIDSAGGAVNKDIIIYSAIVGKEDTGEDMAKIANKTNGLFFTIDEERDISSLVHAATDSVNGQNLEDFVLRLVAPSSVYIDEVTTLQGEKPQVKDTELRWNKISYEKTVALKIKFEVRGDKIDRSLSSLKIEFDLSFWNRLQNKDLEILYNVGTVELGFETEEEYEERMQKEFFEKYKLYIGSIITIAVFVVALLARWRINLKRLRRELDDYIAQANLLENKRDYEGALHHVERAILMSAKLKDDREKVLSKRYKELTTFMLVLKEEKKKAEVLLNEICILMEDIKEFAPDIYLQNSLSDFETLEKEMGPHLRIEKLSHNVSRIFEENDLTQIKELKKRLELIREILSVNLMRIQRAKNLYELTKPTLEILLRGRNLDNTRVSNVIEDPSLSSSVLNFVIVDHQELKSQWNKEIIDEIKDEKKSFLRAQELMKQEDFIKAEDFLMKALEIAQETEQYKLAEKIQKTLRECREEVQNICNEMILTFNEGMELFKNHLYPDAITKFVDVQSLATQINEVNQAERAKQMIVRCEKGDMWEEQKRAIREKMKDVNGIASIEWLAKYVEAEAHDIDELLKNIRDEFNKRGGESIEQYRVYRYENIPIFVDFYALSRYIFDHPGEIGGKIPPNDIEIPIDVQKELLELMKPSRGGKI